MHTCSSFFTLGQSVPISTIEHGCCLLPRINRHHIHPVLSPQNLPINEKQQENEQRQKVEEHVFAKLEEYSRAKSTNIFHLTSIQHIRRRLKRDVKHLSKQFHPYFVSDQKILQWIDETLERIDSHFRQLRSIIDSQNELKNLFLTDQISSEQNSDNQWRYLQIKRAKILFPNRNSDEKELLLQYQNYISDVFTPKRLENDRLPLRNKDQIDLDSEYNQAENIGRECLKRMFDDYKQRQYPNLSLIKEMINLGMEQMVKRPKTEELHKVSESSNILSKALFILKSKNAYSMSLKNIADDFMVKYNFCFSKEI